MTCQVCTVRCHELIQDGRYEEAETTILVCHHHDGHALERAIELIDAEMQANAIRVLEYLGGTS